ncbi:hypothetical protein DFJ74DRAFT_696098 [Hyaloraphidium curvatum]|nr:hypothetical protein DFJ74DRAFT_696098 [Hyaloraphidium curvatum]
MRILRSTSVPGLLIAYDVLTPAGERRLYDASRPQLERGTWKRDKEGTERTGGSGKSLISGPDAFDDGFRVWNLVKDSGMCPELVLADSFQAMEYEPPNGGFHAHWDSRYRWGEFVTTVSLGLGSTASFVLAGSKWEGRPRRLSKEEEDAGFRVEKAPESGKHADKCRNAYAIEVPIYYVRPFTRRLAARHPPPRGRSAIQPVPEPDLHRLPIAQDLEQHAASRGRAVG